MSYQVKEVYYTLQGEGVNAGRPAVFCRFTGCNLWSGREVDRSAATCSFCDTDFLGTDGPGGGRFESAVALAEAVARVWRQGSANDSFQDLLLQSPSAPNAGNRPLVVCTGGEPLLQMDSRLIDALHDQGLQVAIETNGTLPVPPGIDWICCSPKAGADVVLLEGDELKLVYPQSLDPADLLGLKYDHFFIQPMDGPNLEANTGLAIEYCRAHPQWSLSLQTHKILGIP